MLRVKAFLLIGICLLIAGCYIQSLNPVYDNETLTFDSGLIGRWYSPEDDDETWIFEEADENEYTLTGKSNDNGEMQEAHFQAFLSKLEDHLFLDIFPIESETMPDIYLAHLIPVHSFFKFHREGDTLITKSLDYNLFKTAIEQKKTELKYVKLEDRILITASTDEIQKFFVKNAKNDSMFQSPDTLYRKN
jgi:hypothetical protein